MTSLEEQIAQLQNAIAVFESQRLVIGDAVVEAALFSLREKLAEVEMAARPEQQRKQSTVLFADVSGFTTMSETMDPEDVAEVMNDLWLTVDRAIISHGGRIDKHIGDAVMAVWGAEIAQEDDPERAVRAGLAMMASLAEFCVNHAAPLALRIGINTGPVIFGVVGTTGEYTAMGDTVNLASRLEHAAPVGGVLISHDTYRHIRGIFDVRPMEPLAVKGKTETVQTYIVLQAKPRAFHMTMRGVEGIETRMVGRDSELDGLQRAFISSVTASSPSVVTVIGEAGVGKSRLINEFDNWLDLQSERVLYFKGRVSPNYRNVPFSLFRDLFAFRFEILDSDEMDTALSKFRMGMAGYLETEQADVVGHWLGFDFSASDAVAHLLGGGLAATARVYLVRYLRALASRPVVLMLEDIHWADDQSLDLIIDLVENVGTAKILIIAAARRALLERRPSWGDRANFARIDLAPLSEEASRALVDEILCRVDDLPENLRAFIVDKTGGNPFFVEELIKMLLEQGVIVRETRGFQLSSMSSGTDESRVRTLEGDFHPPPDIESWSVRTDKLAGIKVPSTLIGLLQARLDGLPRLERELLQQASIIGRIFWDDAVSDLMQTEREAIGLALKACMRRELIFRRRHTAFAHADEYIFKHALLRDVAYEMVLLKRRAELHGRVARWLERHAGDRLGEFLTFIAEHYVQAGEYVRAATLLEKVGEDSLRIGAWPAARRVLESAQALRDGDRNRSGPESIRLLVILGQACLRMADFACAENALQRGLVAARDVGDRQNQAEALAWLGKLAQYRGEYNQARALFDESHALATELGGRALALTLNQMAWLGLIMGDLDVAQARAAESQRVALALGDAGEDLSAENMAILGNVSSDRDDFAQAGQWYEAALKVARRNGFLAREGRLLTALGTDAYKMGDFPKARTCYQAGLDRYRELGEQEKVALGLLNVADVELRLGNRDVARSGALEGLSLAHDLGVTPWMLFGILVLGEIAADEGNLTQALAYFGFVLAHPATEAQTLKQVKEELSRLNLPENQIQRGVADGAGRDLSALVNEILAG